MNQYNKTRIAPTPSGFLHLGNILSFCITATLARKSHAKILLRIDDLDQPRINEAYLQDIFDILNFLEIPWDEGPRNVKEFKNSYSQSHRIKQYHEAMKQLSDDNLVFACICTRKQLNSNSCSCFKRHIPLTEEDACWRLITADNGDLKVKNYNSETVSASLPRNMFNFIIKRKDGLPSYQLTSVIDDLLYDVDLVVRGEDLWPSTLAQHALASALQTNKFKDITFYHHPLLKESSGKKLSKSAGSTSIHYLRETGKTPAHIYSLIATMLGINQTIKNWRQLGDTIIIMKTNKAGN
jgi:glutamyl/glutaminyl-tRNA synthetase